MREYHPGKQSSQHLDAAASYSHQQTLFPPSKPSGDNSLLKEQNFLNYLNKAQQFPLHQTSLTPNPKLFEMNRAEKSCIKQQKRKPNLSRQGENFAGLQTYIISEIDSGSDQEGVIQSGAGKKLGFLSDASSFSNSDSSDGEAAHHNQNSSCSDEAEEQ